MSLLQEANQILTNAHDLEPHKRWTLPFPMGVFGTLRESQCNNRRMHRGKVAAHFKAFMPHFVAHGLSISFKQGGCAPFEAFFYEQSEWDAMIPGVDSLEGFTPPRNNEDTGRWWGYFRTLAWLHILPNDFDHELFSDVDLGMLRDLNLKEDTWSQYERVPCWVYSSKKQNEAAKDCGTIIWG